MADDAGADPVPELRAALAEAREQLANLRAALAEIVERQQALAPPR